MLLRSFSLKPWLSVILSAFVLLSGMSKNVWAAVPLEQNVIEGIEVKTDAPSDLFPKEWQTQATALDASQEEHARRLVAKALQRYPAGFLKSRLKTIYMLDEIDYGTTSIGGRISPLRQTIYVSMGGSSDLQIEETIHHEIAHLLAGLFQLVLPKDWLASNPPNFRYGKGGLEEATHRSFGAELEETWLKQGFAEEYGTTGPMEDYATVCQNLFLGVVKFWKAYETIPALQKKVDIAIQYYHTLSPVFTLAYFRAFEVTETPVLYVASSGSGFYYPPGAAAIIQVPGGSLVMRDANGIYRICDPIVEHLVGYQPGDKISFPEGGWVTLKKASGKNIDYKPGSSAVFTGKDFILWNRHEGAVNVGFMN